MNSTDKIRRTTHTFEHCQTYRLAAGIAEKNWALKRQKQDPSTFRTCHIRVYRITKNRWCLKNVEKLILGADNSCWMASSELKFSHGCRLAPCHTLGEPKISRRFWARGPKPRCQGPKKLQVQCFCIRKRTDLIQKTSEAVRPISCHLVNIWRKL